MTSSTRMQPCIDLPLAQNVLSETVANAKDYTLMHGISMHSAKVFDRDYVSIAPFVLLPSSFPRREFSKAVKIQTTFNILMHRVAHDYKFLSDNLKDIVQSDKFTANLFSIYRTVHTEGYAQPLSLGLLRSDYMLHADEDTKIIQVELNTIASSFGGLASRVSKYHRYIFNELGHSDKVENSQSPIILKEKKLDDRTLRIQIPDNTAVTGLSGGLIDAWSLYNDEKSVILFVVEDITYNMCDQRSLEFEIRQLNPKVRIIRRTFKNLAQEKAYLGPNKELIVGDRVVSVVYYRTGYQLEAYEGAADWSMRLLIERSRAIKCPSIQYQLAGTKKVQQVLAQPNVLNKFLDNQEADEIRRVFTGLYSLEFNDDGDKAVTMAIANPTKYVLKPQREGGGNNVYGNKVRTVLESMKDSAERKAWILMDLINPPVHQNYLIRSNKDVVLQDLTSELGIYGVVIGDESKIRVNRQVGHVLRSKPVDSSEGGIVAGDGALDSPYLVT